MIDSKLPWLSPSGNRTDLESSSSLSLLHSIYGSQVSQVLQASDDSETNLFATLSESPRHVHQHFPAVQSRSRRPMSSPAATRLEREKKTRSSLRPASALRNRPQTARVLQRATPAGRPRTAIGIRAVPRRMPPTLLLEDVEEEESSGRPAIQENKPVTLTRVPEYINFWEGKPLLQREYGVPVHKRKQWQRPKSDYGSRVVSGRRNRGDLETVVERDDGMGEGLGRQGQHGRPDPGSQTGKLSCDPGLSELTDSSVGARKRDGERNKSAGTNLWAKRAQRAATRENEVEKSAESDDCQDEYFAKPPLDRNVPFRANLTPRCVGGSQLSALGKNSASTCWLDTSARAVRTTRFELPMDLKALETMSPLQYLNTHCIISDYHLSICSKVFTRLDKNRDAHLLQQEVVKGLQEVHYHCLTEAQAQCVLQTAHYPVNMQADLHLFAALCCLAERMYSLHLLPALARREVIECVDFEALEWKLRGCIIGTPLRTLFSQL